MKRVILTALLILALAGTSYAAGTVTVKYGKKTKLTAELIFECTGDAADGTIPDTSSAGKTSLFNEYPYAYRVIIENLSTDTDVTANSDVYIYKTDSAGSKSTTDILGGDGVDQLDADTINDFELSEFTPLHGPVILDVDNQSAVSAGYRVILVLSK
jgi:hypothetical protein